jgi:hypothetical protein
LIAVAIIGVVAVIVTFIQAMVMKFANSVCGGDRIGIFYSAAVVWGSAVAGGICSGATRMALGEEAAWSPALAGVVSSVLSLCLMLQLDPLRAFGVYLVYSLSGAVVLAMVAVVIFVGMVSTVPSETLRSMEAHTSRLGGAADVGSSSEGWTQLMSLGGGGEGGEAPEAPRTVEAGNPFFKSSGPSQASQSGGAKRPAAADNTGPSGTAASNHAASGLPVNALPPNSQSSTDDQESKLPRRLLNDKPPAVNPVGGHVRRNPFVE